MDSDLKGHDIEEIRDAIVAAYPTKDSVKELVHLRFSRNLETIVPGDKQLNYLILDLLNTARAEGWFTEFLKEAQAFNPGNTQLAKAYEAFSGERRQRPNLTRRLSNQYARHPLLLSNAFIAAIVLLIVLAYKYWVLESEAENAHDVIASMCQQVAFLTDELERIEYYPSDDVYREKLLLEIKKRLEIVSKDSETKSVPWNVRILEATVKVQLATGYITQEKELQSAGDNLDETIGILESLSGSDEKAKNLLLSQCKSLKGEWLHLQGNNEAATTSHNDAIQSLEQLSDTDPENTQYAAAAAIALVRHHRATREAGLPIDVALIDRARNIAGEVKPKSRVSCLMISKLCGDEYASLRKYADADNCLRDAVYNLDRKNLDLKKLNNNDSEIRMYADVKQSHGAVLGELGRIADAWNAYGEAIDVFTQFTEYRHLTSKWRENVAIAKTNRGRLLHRLGFSAAAHKYALDACSEFEQLVRSHPEETRFAVLYAACVDSIAQIKAQLSRDPSVRELFESSHKEHRRLIERDDRFVADVAIAFAHCGRFWSEVGEVERAMAIFRETEELLSESAFSSSKVRDAVIRAHLYRHIGMAYKRISDAERSRDYFAKAVSQWRSVAAEMASEDIVEFVLFLLNCPDEDIRDVLYAKELISQLKSLASENAVYHALQGVAHFRDNKSGDAKKSFLVADQLMKDELIALGLDIDERQALGKYTFFLAMCLREDPEKAGEKLKVARQWMDGNMPWNPEIRAIHEEASKYLGIDWADPPKD